MASILRIVVATASQLIRTLFNIQAKLMPNQSPKSNNN